MTQALAERELLKHHEAVIRTMWLDELRTRPARQCRGLKQHKCDATGQFLYWQVCVMALLGEILHGPIWWSKCPGEDDMAHLYGIGAKAGLDTDQVDELVARNDGHIDWEAGIHHDPHSYDQLADIIEAWFPANHAEPVERVEAKRQ